ncbi:MAG: ATP-binding protein [Acetatifactor sp.]|nr:ATP-binding protein [Acetatifactor sp.]
MHELIISSEPGLLKQRTYLFFNEMDFILIMFIVLMISACFFGRQVVITRKMVIASMGIVLIEPVITVLRERFMKQDPLIGEAMQLRRTPQFFVIKITNSAKGKIDVEKLFAMEGYTTKRDARDHGFGLRNIHQHVEAYDGMIKAESAEDTFALSIMIPKRDGKEDANKGKNAKKEKKYA